MLLHLVLDKNAEISERTKEEEKENKFPEKIKITYKGMIFEGYERMQQRLDADANKSNQYKIDQMANQRKMNRLTWILAVGTSIAALYYLIEITKWFSEK